MELRKVRVLEVVKERICDLDVGRESQMEQEWVSRQRDGMRMEITRTANV